jgi:hypothetical protein
MQSLHEGLTFAGGLFSVTPKHFRPCAGKRNPAIRPGGRQQPLPASRDTGGSVIALRKIKGMFLAGMLLSAGIALASSKGSLELQHPTNVAGKQLPTGSYTVQWDGSGDQVELKIMQGKKEVATTSAKVVKVEHPLPHDAAITAKDGDGSFSLSQIVFGGKKFALELSNDNGAAGGSAAAGAR